MKKESAVVFYDEAFKVKKETDKILTKKQNKKKLKSADFKGYTGFKVYAGKMIP